ARRAHRRRGPRDRTRHLPGTTRRPNRLSAGPIPAGRLGRRGQRRNRAGRRARSAAHPARSGAASQGVAALRAGGGQPDALAVQLAGPETVVRRATAHAGLDALLAPAGGTAAAGYRTVRRAAAHLHALRPGHHALISGGFARLLPLLLLPPPSSFAAAPFSPSSTTSMAFS